MLNALRTALSTLGRLAPLGSPENTGQRYRIELERDAASRSDVIVVSSRFDHNGQRPEVYAKEEVPDILSEDSDQHDAMVLAAAMRLLVAVAGTTALVRAGAVKWTGAPIDALEEQTITRDAATLQQHARIVPTAYGEALHLPYLAESVVCAPRQQSPRIARALRMAADPSWQPTADMTPAARPTVTTGPNGSYTVDIGNADLPNPHDSAAWSAELRAKLAASEVLRGPTIACQGDWEDD